MAPSEPPLSTTNTKTAAIASPDPSSPTKPEPSAILLDADAAHLENGHFSALKLAKDGHTVLAPQPTSDPNDPLNWSWRRKHVLLAVISTTAFLGDFASACGIPLVVLQGEEWGLSPAKVNEAGNLKVLMLGVGGLFWIVIASWWGRAPVMFWSTLLGTICMAVSAAAPSFAVWYGFRVLTGFTLTAMQVVGLACLHDMFYVHEHARKIGIWVSVFILAPYLGPFLANFMIDGTGQWRGVIWMCFGVGAADLLAIVLVGDETFYERSVPVERQPVRGDTERARLERLLGVWQVRHHGGYFCGLGLACRRLLSTLLKPIMIPTMLYYAMSFMWAVGLNITSTLLVSTPVEDGGYGFDARSMGFLYFAPLSAVGLGEAFGHFFNDWIAARYVRKHGGMLKPEARLLTTYVAAVFLAVGLIVVGQTLEKRLSVVGLAFGWWMNTFGIMLSSVSVTAYVSDSYGVAGSEVSGLLNFARVISGFSVGYFQQPWGQRNGFGMSFGIQAAIVAAGLGIIVILQVYGERMRAKGGQVV